MVGATFVLLLSIGYIGDGYGVSLTEFESTGLKPYTRSNEPGTDSIHPWHTGVVAVNQTLLYVSDSWMRPQSEFLVSIANLTDRTWTHKQVNKPYTSTDYTLYRLFVLNSQAYLLVCQSDRSNTVIVALAVWENNEWRNLNGSFPYILIEDEEIVWHVGVNPSSGVPNVAIIGTQAVSNDRIRRYDFHRLTLNGDQVVVQRIAGFHGNDLDTLQFYTQWNGKLLAYICETPAGNQIFTAPIANSPMGGKDNSSGVVNQTFPQLHDAQGRQIGNYVVFTGGFYLDNWGTALLTSREAVILDLNTMAVTKTATVLRQYSQITVDVETKRVYNIRIYDGDQVATLQP